MRNLTIAMLIVVAGSSASGQEKATSPKTPRLALVAGRSYRVRIHDSSYAVNMSAFEHFAHYTGGAGGERGPVNRMEVESIRLLLRRR